MESTMTDLDNQVRDTIETLLPELVELRHDIHAHPELGYEEHRTNGVVREQLEQAGIEHAGDLAGGTGILGHLPGKADTAIGLRADMDALPITECTGLPYASTHEGVMHACGHDGHTTILVGAARVLAEIAGNTTLPNPVSFVFQPAEEGGGGGRRMVEDGCLDGRVKGPPIRTMFGLHGWPQWAQGIVGTRPGPMLAAADRFEVVIKGLGGHAAMPHTTRDPVLAAAAITTALQQVVSRNIDPIQGAVISVTRIEGGTAFNIIPEECVIAGTVRALYDEALQVARTRLDEIVHGVARTWGCEATLEYEEGYPVTRNDPDAVLAFERIAREALGSERIQPLESPVMGAEDFSYYGQQVPSCFFVLGLLPPGMDSMPSLHHPCFNFNDETISTGVELFCRLALRG